VNNDESRDFCLQLLKADTEDEVICILQNAGYWDDPTVWRDFGDNEGNFATVGNQQSRPEAALVEKLVNSVDARLTNACLEAGINPESPEAPQSMGAAVATFFDGFGGSLKNWTPQMRRNVGKGITLAATGSRRHPCITITDCGEGQLASNVPRTFMSLHASNKLRIPFVQGKFNMGGSGVIKFCGEERFQLIITKRNPAILTCKERSLSDASKWSVTITRRLRPSAGAGAVKNSVIKYLAPLGACDDHSGDVLRFASEGVLARPQHDSAYELPLEYGSVIKLYAYDMRGFKSHILLPDGLLYRLEVLLPQMALPVNLHECRDYSGGKQQSFVTPLAGLAVRLDKGRGGNVVDGFPDSVPFCVDGEHMVAKIYAFKAGKAATYRTNEGVIFTINGQTHGCLPVSIFSRKKVRLGRLATSLLVMVDCTNLSGGAREDLFMNSRDRLSGHQLRKRIEAEIEDILSRHGRLKELANERRQQEIGEQLADGRPLEQVLRRVLRSSPAISALLQIGTRLGNPFKPKKGSNGDGKNGSGRGGSNGHGPGDDPFVGKMHPSFFRFRRKEDGVSLVRECEQGRRCRMTLETDVQNEYFDRSDNCGSFDVEIVEDTDGLFEGESVQNSLILHAGVANWSVELPDEAEAGQTIVLQLTVNDATLQDPIVNVARLTVKPRVSHPAGGGGIRRSSTAGGTGQQPSGLEMPDIVRVMKKDWESHEFDEGSSCEAVLNPDSSYTFYVNVDNLSLLRELKASKDNPSVLKAKFIFANVLVGLALLQAGKDRNDSSYGQTGEESEAPVEVDIRRTTRALGPFLLPMINCLGAIADDDVASAAQTGDDE
jgi:hypothetical protein